MKFPLLHWHMICEEISFLRNVDKPRFGPPNVRTSEPRNHTHKFSSTNIRKHLLLLLRRRTAVQRRTIYERGKWGPVGVVLRLPLLQAGQGDSEIYLCNWVVRRAPAPVRAPLRCLCSCRSAERWHLHSGEILNL